MSKKKKKPHEMRIDKLEMAGRWILCHNMTWLTALQNPFVSALELENGDLYVKADGQFWQQKKGEESCPST